VYEYAKADAAAEEAAFVLIQDAAAEAEAEAASALQFKETGNTG
jgi:hypothetical protein